MTRSGKPTHAGQVLRQAGAVATAVKTNDGLRWEVRRESDGLLRYTKCLAQKAHWRES